MGWLIRLITTQELQRLKTRLPNVTESVTITFLSTKVTEIER